MDAPAATGLRPRKSVGFEPPGTKRRHVMQKSANTRLDLSREGRANAAFM